MKNAATFLFCLIAACVAQANDIAKMESQAARIYYFRLHELMNSVNEGSALKILSAYDSCKQLGRIPDRFRQGNIEQRKRTLIAEVSRVISDPDGRAQCFRSMEPVLSGKTPDFGNLCVAPEPDSNQSPYLKLFGGHGGVNTSYGNGVYDQCRKDVLKAIAAREALGRAKYEILARQNRVLNK